MLAQAFDERTFRQAQRNFYEHLRYAKRRGYDLDTDGMEAVLTRRDNAVVLRFPLEVLADRFGLSNMGV